MEKRICGEKGLTLVEVIVASLIVATVAAGILSVFVTGGRMTQVVDQRTLAVNYAQETLEGLKNSVSSDTTESQALDVSFSYVNPGLTGLPAGTTRRYDVQDVNVGGVILKKVTVTVDWPDP
ncbi:MAG: prepilin-type N-terminal cleavage/methylation domain-containing protein [Candidatus Omnitrophica bacterium]|nr:prepilin-type N-terminal cleavage/methylation domain-containing protein [Candidatus Omnitrophota bacterium]